MKLKCTIYCIDHYGAESEEEFKSDVSWIWQTKLLTRHFHLFWRFGWRLGGLARDSGGTSQISTIWWKGQWICLTYTYTCEALFVSPFADVKNTHTTDLTPYIAKICWKCIFGRHNFGIVLVAVVYFNVQALCGNFAETNIYTHYFQKVRIVMLIIMVWSNRNVAFWIIVSAQSKPVNLGLIPLRLVSKDTIIPIGGIWWNHRISHPPGYLCWIEQASEREAHFQDRVNKQ